VDESGVVHYGDSVPEKFRNNGKIVPLRSDTPTAAQVREAQLRLEGQRAALQAACGQELPLVNVRSGAQWIATPKLLPMPV
jgi:hypothetical protein